jgi:hypothetical protein
MKNEKQRKEKVEEKILNRERSTVNGESFKRNRETADIKRVM